MSLSISVIVHSATTALGGLLMGLSGTETTLVSDEEEEGEARILWNFGYKNICKKKCCYKCCEVNKIICLLQGGPYEFYTGSLNVLNAIYRAPLKGFGQV